MRHLQDMPANVEWALIAGGVVILLMARVWLKRRLAYLARIDPMAGFLSRASSRGLHPGELADRVAGYQAAGLVWRPTLALWFGWAVLVGGIAVVLARREARIAPYALSLFAAIVISRFLRAAVLAKIYREYKEERIGLFAGRNTWLVIEWIHKALTWLLVAYVGAATFASYGVRPTLWLAVLYALFILSENLVNFSKNIRARSPRPGVYLVGGLVADGTGLALGLWAFT